MVEEDARVVDQHVDSAQRVRRLVDHAPGLTRVGDVRLDDRVALAGQFGAQAFRQVKGVTVVDRDSVAGGCEGRGDRPSDPSRATGDQYRSSAHSGHVSRHSQSRAVPVPPV
jgi:hypothetical protein